MAAERAFVRTVIFWDISDARMGLGDCGMAVMVVVCVASFSAKHWNWLSSPLNVFVKVSMICCVAVWMQVVILSCSVLR